MNDEPMLPGEWPEPVLTCDLILKREITDALSQFEYWTHAMDQSGRFEVGDKSDAAMAAKYKSLMHLQSYIAAAAIADLLRTIQGMAPGIADEIAREFMWTHESGDSGELLWEWAVERGLDPEEIIEDVKHKLAQEGTS